MSEFKDTALNRIGLGHSEKGSEWAKPFNLKDREAIWKYIGSLGRDTSNESSYKTRWRGARRTLAAITLAATAHVYVVEPAIDRINGPECKGIAEYVVPSGGGIDDITTEVPGEFNYLQIRDDIIAMNPGRPINDNLTQPGVYLGPESCES
jgi:hypothetical protein